MQDHRHSIQIGNSTGAVQHYPLTGSGQPKSVAIRPKRSKLTPDKEMVALRFYYLPPYIGLATLKSINFVNSDGTGSETAMLKDKQILNIRNSNP